MSFQPLLQETINERDLDSQAEIKFWLPTSMLICVPFLSARIECEGLIWLRRDIIKPGLYYLLRYSL